MQAAQTSPVFRAHLARLDLGQDAHPSDIRYHMTWLLNLEPAAFREYIASLTYALPTPA